MPSLVTQSIGVAVAATTTNPNQVNPLRDSQQALPTQQQVHQDLRAAAQAATVSIKMPDKERAPQVPKRTEATYSSIPRRKRPGKNPKQEDQEEGSPNNDLNLTK